MSDIYLLMSASAQFLFAVSAVPFWWGFRKSQRVFGLFEWTWMLAELLMISGSIGLERFDLVPGLAINFIFLLLCLLKSLENKKMLADRANHLAKAMKDLSDRGISVQVWAPGSVPVAKEENKKLALVKDEETGD
jgi:hypothetical protein